MWGFLAALGLGGKLVKEEVDDSKMRGSSIKNGCNFYASSTGIRDAKTNRKVCINNGRMIDVKTYRDLGKAFNETKYDDPTRYGRIFTGGACVAGDTIIVDLAKLAKKRGKKYYEFKIGEYIETTTGRRVLLGWHYEDDEYEFEVLDYNTRKIIRLEKECPWGYMTLTHMEWNNDDEIWKYYKVRKSIQGGKKIYWE